MKLLATTFCLAALSVTGCATDDETNMGGYLAGMRPAKPALDNGEGDPPVPQNTGDKEARGMVQFNEDFVPDGVTATDVKPDIPLPENICENCDLIYITIPPNSGIRDASEFGEIRVVSDGGDQLCRIFMNQDGSPGTVDCSLVRN